MVRVDFQEEMARKEKVELLVPKVLVVFKEILVLMVLMVLKAAEESP